MKELSKVAAVKGYLERDATPISAGEFMIFYKTLGDEEREEMASQAIEALRAAGEDVKLKP